MGGGVTVNMQAELNRLLINKLCCSVIYCKLDLCAWANTEECDINVKEAEKISK